MLEGLYGSGRWGVNPPVQSVLSKGLGLSSGVLAHPVPCPFGLPGHCPQLVPVLALGSQPAPLQTWGRGAEGQGSK